MTTVADAYQRVIEQVAVVTNRDESMKRVVDAMWHEMQSHDVSWLGFYIDQPTEPDDRRLILGPHRDKPACSPIGLHGVCGQALLSGQAQIVDDVHALGENYVACDPRDRAELVIPLFERGECWGVFDMDSFSPGRFTESDRQGVERILFAAGFELRKE